MSPPEGVARRGRQTGDPKGSSSIQGQSKRRPTELFRRAVFGGFLVARLVLGRTAFAHAAHATGDGARSCAERRARCRPFGDTAQRRRGLFGPSPRGLLVRLGVLILIVRFFCHVVPPCTAS